MPGDAPVDHEQGVVLPAVDVDRDNPPRGRFEGARRTQVSRISGRIRVPEREGEVNLTALPDIQQLLYKEFLPPDTRQTPSLEKEVPHPHRFII